MADGHQQPTADLSCGPQCTEGRDTEGTTCTLRTFWNLQPELHDSGVQEASREGCHQGDMPGGDTLKFKR